MRRGARYATWGTNIIFLWCSIIFVRDSNLRFDAIQGSSMAPSLNPSVHETGKRDWVFFTPYWERSSRRPKSAKNGEESPDDVFGVQRGDVVTFWKPHKPGEVSIKRVVAIQGDTVYPRRGYALDPKVVMGDRLMDVPDGLPDIDEDTILGGRVELGKVVVPYGHVWVEGDNSRKSLDSNDFGPISKGLIKEKAVWVWRGWTEFLQMKDARDSRDKALASRVVPGKSDIPIVFLE